MIAHLPYLLLFLFPLWIVDSSNVDTSIVLFSQPNDDLPATEWESNALRRNYNLSEIYDIAALKTASMKRILFHRISI
jgi:hypothetical protein